MQTISASSAGSSSRALAALLLAWAPMAAALLLVSADARAANFIGLAGCVGATLSYTVWEWFARPALRAR